MLLIKSSTQVFPFLFENGFGFHMLMIMIKKSHAWHVILESQNLCMMVLGISPKHIWHLSLLMINLALHKFMAKTLF